MREPEIKSMDYLNGPYKCSTSIDTAIEKTLFYGILSEVVCVHSFYHPKIPIKTHPDNYFKALPFPKLIVAVFWSRINEVVANARSLDL